MVVIDYIRNVAVAVGHTLVVIDDTCSCWSCHAGVCLCQAPLSGRRSNLTQLCPFPRQDSHAVCRAILYRQQETLTCTYTIITILQHLSAPQIWQLNLFIGALQDHKDFL